MTPRYVVCRIATHTKGQLHCFIWYFFFFLLSCWCSGPTNCWQTDRQTDRQKDRQTDKQTDRQTDRQTDKQTDRQTDRHWQTTSYSDLRCLSCRCSGPTNCWQTQTDGQTDGRTQTDGQTDGQTDRLDRRRLIRTYAVCIKYRITLSIRTGDVEPDQTLTMHIVKGGHKLTP